MRGVIVAASLFFVMLAGIILIQQSIEKTSEKIVAQIGDLEEKIEAEDWDGVDEGVKKLEADWEKDAKWISMLVDHDEIDLIMTTVAALKEYEKYRDLPELMAEISTLERLIEHIPHKEAPILENIF